MFRRGMRAFNARYVKTACQITPIASTMLFMSTRVSQQDDFALPSRKQSISTTTPIPEAQQDEIETNVLNNDPLLTSTFKSMSANSVPFFLNSADIQVIERPDEFYNTLIDLVKSAQSRVCLSALYFGSSAMEQQLVDTIAQSLKDHPRLHAHFVFDRHRGQRKDKEGRSSLSLTLDLLQSYSSRVSTALFCPPIAHSLTQSEPNPLFSSASSTEKKMWAEVCAALHKVIGGRGKELMSVHHMKAYIVDDTIILSGANLSEVYFKQRQDRYLMIRSRELSDYVTTLLQVMSLSPHADLYGQDSLPVQVSLSREDRDKQVTPANAVPAFWTDNGVWLRDSGSGSGESLAVSATKRGVDAIRRSRHYLHANDHFVHTLADMFTPDRDRSPVVGVGADTVLFPSVQIGSLGVRHDQHVTSSLFHDLQTYSQSHADERLTVHLATGYFNLTQHYMNLLRDLCSNSNVSLRVLAAGTQANGWIDAKGVTANIPPAYGRLADTFLAYMRGVAGDVGLLEYKRPDWTYHAKGLWAQSHSQSALTGNTHTPAHCHRKYEGQSLNPRSPLVTMLGSSNFGVRSVERDSELQVTMLVKNPVLIAAMKSDLDNTLSYSHDRPLPDTPRTQDPDPLVRESENRRHSPLFKVLYPLMKPFL